ncbi:hypothetical protein VOLCADRAFT_104514 [Volvox carteri f. nagariensis]|uniref:Uncharacterized protein mot48 n=1 Tax=Volvox carteri f. nagariensis TaxID=3068 RepID=D8TU45_VOLCA|nr:uncharacterized protein VOLCADRAFT_104514 [Volvox carteri f. nagariensis]EFJ49078.1 hypothetical protein VOLCADRAFT_104514 [Volvox carteri f. nagariensis]|eukprot:XP_002949975.1 hypothetical protein VOLCADRAFT_104514 [Volvox carteri f. nagariensis]
MIPQAGPAQTASEGPAPSPEELLAMVEFLQQQGLNMDQAPPDLKASPWNLSTNSPVQRPPGLMNASYKTFSPDGYPSHVLTIPKSLLMEHDAAPHGTLTSLNLAPTMLENVKKQKAAKAGTAPPPDAPTEEITPTPGFVIKTSEVASGRKVFINVCCSERVAAPGGWSNGVMPDEVAAALDKLQRGEDGAAAMTPGEVEALRFPLSCGPPRSETDRKGAPCTAVDVVFNSDVVRAAAAARKLKAMLIEVATGWVANKLSVELDPRYKLPKMRYKGEVVATQRIRAEDKCCVAQLLSYCHRKKKLVTELRDVDEEPAFALRTTKAATQPPPPSQQQQAAAAATAAAPQRAGVSSSGGDKLGAVAPAGAVAVATAAKGTGLGDGGGGGGLSYKVEYEGRPVEWILVTLELPQGAATATSTTSGGHHQQLQPPDVAIDVCGRTLYVRRPGHPELLVPLLFAATTTEASASASVKEDRSCEIVVRLPYRSLDEHLADARAQAPLAFGQLNFASKALLELEP